MREQWAMAVLRAVSGAGGAVAAAAAGGTGGGAGGAAAGGGGGSAGSNVGDGAPTCQNHFALGCLKAVTAASSPRAWPRPEHRLPPLNEEPSSQDDATSI